MLNIRNLHRESMDIAEQAYRARRTGEYALAKALFVQAYEMEVQAASVASKEPSRSVFYRSAATLAVHAQLYREAEKAVSLGLSGDPPPEIATELREVFERANFHRHLSLNGIQLATHEIQMSITGNVIAPGMALIGAVFTRVEQLEKMIIRTAQRLNNRPYAKSLGANDYSLYMSVPRASSFAVTLALGEPEQLLLPGLDDRPKVIDEVLFGLNLINEKRLEELRIAIPNDSYRQSFLGLAKALAPDGENVRLVGVTAYREGTEASVGLSVTSKEIKPALDAIVNETEDQKSSQETQIIGELFFAEEAKKNHIKIRDDSGNIHKIEVSEAIAEDVVKPFFGSRVIVDVARSKKRLIFRDINPAPIEHRATG